MGAQPETTVIIPAFNAAGTIGRTLASLIAQTRDDWEAVIVDDGSTDGMEAVVGGWLATDPRIRLLRQANGGAAAARNAGLAAARGAWTLFLDADDTIDRHYLRRMQARLRADTTADAVCCGYVRRSVAGGVLARYRAPRLDRDPIGHCTRGPPTAIHAILSRTAMLRDLGGFDIALTTNEDWDLWLRTARAGARFTVERRALAQYWCAPASLTRDGTAMLRDTLTMLARGDPPGSGGRPDAALEALLWNAGVAIGGGGDGLSLLSLIPRLPTCASLERSIGALAEGLMLGLAQPFAALLPAWDVLGPKVEALLAEIGILCGDPATGDALARGIERAVIRMGRFRCTVRVGRTLGVMLSPRCLRSGIAPVADETRVVIRMPLVRPRSLLMVEADLAAGLSGGAILKLLAMRIWR